jgi:hypothetical protein
MTSIPMRCWPLLSVLALGPPPGAQQPPESLDVWLSRPASPGTLAALIPHSADARVEERWRQSLAHSDARTRGTAARLLLVSVRGASASALADSLAKETDEAAALEEARALLWLTTSGAESVVLGAAKRFGAGPFALTLAEARGRAALPLLSRLRELELDAATEESVVASLCRGDVAAFDSVAGTALESEDVALWRATLNAAYREGAKIQAHRISMALEARSSEIQDLAWWHVAARTAATNERTVWAKLSPPPISPAEFQSGAFGRELANRLLFATQLDRSKALAGDLSGFPTFGWAALRGPLSATLTTAERELLGVPTPEEVKEAAAARSQQAKPATYSRTHTVGRLPAGYVDDVLRVTGCRPGDGNDIGGAVTRHDGDGRLAELKWVAAGKAGACGQASHLVTAAALVPSRATSSLPGPQLLALPLHDVPAVPCKRSVGVARTRYTQRAMGANGRGHSRGDAPVERRHGQAAGQDTTRQPGLPAIGHS